MIVVVDASNVVIPLFELVVLMYLNYELLNKRQVDLRRDRFLGCHSKEN